MDPTSVGHTSLSKCISIDFKSRNFAVLTFFQSSSIFINLQLVSMCLKYTLPLCHNLAHSDSVMASVLHAVLQHCTHGFRSQPHRLRTDLNTGAMPQNAPKRDPCFVARNSTRLADLIKLPRQVLPTSLFFGGSYLSYFKILKPCNISSADVCPRNASFWGCCSQNQAPCDQATDSKDTHPIQPSARIARIKYEIH